MYNNLSMGVVHMKKKNHYSTFGLLCHFDYIYFRNTNRDLLISSEKRKNSMTFKYFHTIKRACVQYYKIPFIETPFILFPVIIKQCIIFGTFYVPSLHL